VLGHQIYVITKYSEGVAGIHDSFIMEFISFALPFLVIAFSTFVGINSILTSIASPADTFRDSESLD